MYYVVYSSTKGYFIVQANDELERQRYETNSHFQSPDRSECQSFIDDMANQEDDSDYDYDETGSYE
jgi:hypothetical protein